MNDETLTNAGPHAVEEAEETASPLSSVAEPKEETTAALVAGVSSDAQAAAGAPAFARRTARMSGRRKVLSILGVLLLLITVLSGSVFAAYRLTGAAPALQGPQLLTDAGTGQQLLSQKLGAGARATATQSCNCVSKHTTYAPPPFQPSGAGQVVIVSLKDQQLWAFQNGQMVLTSLVTTGMPQLPTPTGTFHIMMKESNIWFYSPWPYGSPYYYTPEHIDYAMLFRAGGFYLHNAPWRETFGPGTNVPHTEPDGTWATGSHGCVNMPTNTAAQLYRWIGIGATVIIQY